MKKSYYLFNPGLMERRDHTLKYTPIDEEGHTGTPRHIPVEGVENLYVFGSLRMNSALMNFLGKQRIAAHFFDYYEHYTGSFMPKEYLLAGEMQLRQTEHYLRQAKRQELAQKLVQGAYHNMRKNLQYYSSRGRKEVQPILEDLETWLPKIEETADVPTLMGIEGNIRMRYYSAFEHIVSGLPMGNRAKQPPSNELNALISFGNTVCYTLCLDQIYHTQLNATISFLHEPGTRRYSLALDLAEIFKPLLVDRTIFALVNKRIIRKEHFEAKSGGVWLKESGRRKFMEAWDKRLKETIKHRGLGKSVSYKRLVRLECYKLSKHLLSIEPYKPFVIWW